MPFAADLLAYHPAGETHQDLYQIEQEEYAHAQQLGIQYFSQQISSSAARLTAP